jgi:hypothetical protein
MLQRARSKRLLPLRRLAALLLLVLGACDGSADRVPEPPAAGAGGTTPAVAMPVGQGGAAGIDGPAVTPGPAGAQGGVSGNAPGQAGAAASGGVGASAGAPGTAGAAGTPSTAGTTGAAAAGAAGMAGSDATPAMADCDRACLTALNDAYLAALIAHDATKLATADSVRFTENGKELQLNQGLWAVAKSLRPFRQDFAEVPAGQTAGFAALDDDAGVVLLAFRLKVVAREVTEIETLVVRQGQATFFSPASLSMRDPLYDMEVPAASRLPRDRMIEVVDSYFKGIESGDGSAIPVDDGAARNENGTVTARGSSIQNLSMFAYIETVKRRYVLVDEERGIVLPFVLFEIPQGLGGSRTLHLAELFKVSDGKIMDILAIMVNQPLGTPSGWE